MRGALKFGGEYCMVTCKCAVDALVQFGRVRCTVWCGALPVVLRGAACQRKNRYMLQSQEAASQKARSIKQCRGSQSTPMAMRRKLKELQSGKHY